MPRADFASSDQEAQERYERYRALDPFPSIPPALLNSAQLADYVAATGMIHEFHEDADHLKPASYEVALGGPYVYWNEQGARQEDTIEDGQDFHLEPNSIAFVTLKPMLRLPDYLAIRFNLRITHVYQGLLLGTGPLVDPGFQGLLSMPLHNLTTNRYTLTGGDPLIWLEVTKLSPEHSAKRDQYERRTEVFKLPTEKQNLSLRKYLKKADEHRPIRSSIPDVIESSKKSATDAARSALQARNIGLLAGLGVVLGVGAMLISTWSLVHDVSTRLDGVSTRVEQLLARSATDQQVVALNARVCELESELKHPVPTGCPSPLTPSPKPSPSP